MDELSLKHEKEKLEDVLDLIDTNIEIIEKQIKKLEEEMGEFTHYFSEEYYNMDEEEAVCGGDEMDEQEIQLNAIKQQLYKLKRQRLSPYFGRIDFKENQKESLPYYIGVFSLTQNGTALVCDWRAPLSSMYYDFELGEAFYTAPVGDIKGIIEKKRQYKIKNSQMELCFESSLTIGDEILQKELASNATNKMKTIISTIQKEQNKIIRNNKNSVLLVQGVAGSGKTSVALHRVAYMLYSNRGEISSKDILIISPNNVFSEYISNVLPELGEENILHTSFLQIAKKELEGVVTLFEERSEMLEAAVNNKNQRLNEIAYKNCYDFYDSLNVFLRQVALNFKASDFRVGNVIVSKQEISDLYNKKYSLKTPAVRVEWITDLIIERLNMGKKAALIYDRVKTNVYKMLGVPNVLDLYSAFLKSIGLGFKLNEHGKLKYEDVAAVLYIKSYFMGIAKQNEVKHLLIDEMQDYSFVHFDLFNQIFGCNKTILGDINQCIEKIMTIEDMQKIAKIIGADDVVYLDKSYRSTYEIAELADKVLQKTSQKITRHGKAPEMFVLNSFEQEIQKITQIIKELKNYQTVAVICKNKHMAKKYYYALCEFENLVLLEENSAMSNLMIMPASLSKGLEFDAVIIVGADKNSYNSFVDKNVLYVSCTRALHELYITAQSELCNFIK